MNIHHEIYVTPFIIKFATALIIEKQLNVLGTFLVELWVVGITILAFLKVKTVHILFFYAGWYIMPTVVC